MNKYLVFSSTKYSKKIAKKDNFFKKNFIFYSQKNDLSYSKIKKINPKIIFFPHWRHIIPSEIHSNFKCIGFHCTPLPYGRGGSPLQNMIIRGFKKTKICALKIEKRLDAGPIFLKESFDLKGRGEDIMFKMNKVTLKMIKEIIRKKINPKKQIGKIKIFKRRKPKESKIKFNQNINKIYDQIRMLDIDGYPTAFFDDKKYNVTFTNAVKSGDEIKCLSVIRRKK